MTTTTTTIAIDGLMPRAPDAISLPAFLRDGPREPASEKLALIVGGNLPAELKLFVHAVEKGSAAGAEIGAEMGARTGDPTSEVGDPLASAVGGGEFAAFKFVSKFSL